MRPTSLLPRSPKVESRSAFQKMEQLESHNSGPEQWPRGFLQKVKCMFFCEETEWRPFPLHRKKRERKKGKWHLRVCASLLSVCVRAKLPICSAFAARRGSPFGAEIVLLHGHLESLFTMMRLRLAVTPKTPMRYTSHSLFGSSNAPFAELQTSG